MKKKSDESGFLASRLLIGLLVLWPALFWLPLVLAYLPMQSTQQRETKSAPNGAQARNIKPSPQQPNQAFWAQTNGPQGGDGIALATNPSGHVFVGTQGGGMFPLHRQRRELDGRQ